MRRREARQNEIAGRILRRVRESTGASQTEFAPALGALLGIKLGQVALSQYEIARRSVPAAVLIAAVELADLDLAAVIGVEMGAQAAYLPRSQRRRLAGRGNRKIGSE